jgi:hypothetical protein
VLSETNNFQDERDFWKILAFDHAWPQIHFICT